ncbi:MarR family winged helix-turn-helix transcriptional regulator [Brevibacillus centrosporus]|uniref:DNA-binding transcriptional regulator, MarR family n=1 Tax=Brevibacillus centrosporus TaxID=54910 RepID=A0A1I3YFK6_9BACL|nr:MarR family transcriptional regulator [Brevibacillus centrosporus]SFK30638.1 DNA-binding transcriptional regulator, MarR family [Brevibacillus centrosporus]
MDKTAFFQKFVAFTTAVHQVKHDLTKDLKPADITPVQYSILEYIAVQQPVTLSEISDCQHMSMPNTSREIRKLTEKGLCEKTAVAEDQRKQSIRLTPEGKAMMDEAFARIEARFLHRLQGASEGDLKTIEQALDVLQAKVFHTE